jgi:SAM-dependent methyltransferase
MKRFDSIAHIYDSEIPDHIRTYLVRRKTGFILRRIESLSKPSGLDVGCGTGWHIRSFAGHGFKMTGLDSSKDQVANAKENNQNSNSNLLVGDALKCPFSDNQFDFIYSINVMHHLKTKENQLEMFAEIDRLLKHEGYFFLHEINTLNPIFKFYMDHIFPVLNRIDDGTEEWIRPDKLTDIGNLCLLSTDYFTFLPNFTPKICFGPLKLVERILEATPLKRFSAHYMATFQKQKHSSL